MRIRTTKTKNGRLFYVIKTYYDSKGNEHSMTVEKLGNENDIRAKYGQDPDEWAKEHVRKLNEKEKKEKEDITLTFSPGKRMTKNYRYEYQIGYLFLQKIYHELKLDLVCKAITRRRSFNYDLNNILSRLLYGRIIEPNSKRATCRFAETLIEQPKFKDHQVYRTLSVLASESDFIQEQLYKNSFAMGKRHTGVIYYDCTNFFFEIEQSDEDGLRAYGKSKENRPLPIVEMGMFTDHDGIPLAFSIHPGNTNEQVTLRPLEKKLLSDFGMSKFVVCTDAGLASMANKRFNNVQDRAYITTQSLKKLKAEQKEWALSPKGWSISGSAKGRGRKKLYDLNELDLVKDYEKTFYKECLVDRGTFEETLIVTFSLKYQQYQRNIRQGQIDRAQRAIDNGNAKRGKKNQQDYRRFIQKTAVTPDGEVAEKIKCSLDEERIHEEEKYDGFYAVTHNMDDTPEDIIRVNHQRWQIEECFRIMKSEFGARPVYVSLKDHIEAHFLTCFLALIIYRYLEKRLHNEYTCSQIISTLQDMTVREVLGEGYLPNYMRTDITDALHDAFDFRTDFDIIPSKQMKKIIKFSKART